MQKDVILTPEGLEKLKLEIEHLGPDRASRYLRKFHPWYVDTLGEGKAVREALQRADSLDEQRTVIGALRALPCAAALT